MRENPSHSSYINFVRAIRGRAYERGLVFRSFRKLVSKEDYAGVSVDELSKNWPTTRQKTLILSHIKNRPLVI